MMRRRASNRTLVKCIGVTSNALHQKLFIDEAGLHQITRSNLDYAGFVFGFELDLGPCHATGRKTG